MKNQKLFLLIIFSGFILFFASGALAIEKTIQQSVKDVFWWAIAIAGLLSAISFVFGAVQYMLSDHASGKDRMLGSVFGLVLIFSSWIILQTINPKIATLNLDPLMPVGVGVYYFGTGTDEKNPLPPVPTQVSNTSDVLEKGYQQISYRCFLKDENGRMAEQPTLLVWKYNKPNFVSSKTSGIADDFERIYCNGHVAIPSGGSFKYAFENPGVYFYDGINCDADGVSSEVFNSSLSPIPEPFNGNIRSLRIVNGKGDQMVGGGTGVILHQSSTLDEGGLCEAQILNSAVGGAGDCKKLQSNISVHSADIFYMAKNPKTSGTGVNFYSNILGWQENSDAGKYEVLPNDITRIYRITSDRMIFKWKDARGAMADRCNQYPNACTKESPSKCCSCRTFYDCPLSIQAKGDYIISIDQVINQANNSKKDWCQTFIGNVDNLGTKSFFTPQSTGNGLDRNYNFSVYIIPITH